MKLAIVAFLLLSVGAVTGAQVSHTCPNGPSTVGDCSGGGGGGGNGGIVGLFSGMLNPSVIFNPGPSAAQLRAQRLQAEAQALNNQGIAAENRGDWATAYNDFQAALARTPGDGVIRQNLGGAQGRLGIDAYNRQDWATAANLFRAARANNPGDPNVPAWLQLAQQNYQNALAQRRQAAVDETNREIEELQQFEQQQAAEAQAAQQRKDQAVADSVQQTMRDFLATLDQSSDQYRLGSNSAAPNGATAGVISDQANNTSPAAGGSGLTFMASAASTPAAPGSTVAAAAANQPAAGLQFMPAGEIRDAAVDAPAKAPPAARPTQDNGSAGAGAPAPQNAPQNAAPLALPQPPAEPGTKAPEALDFDQRNGGQTAGPAAPGLVFQPAAQPTAGATTPAHGAPAPAPQTQPAGGRPAAAPPAQAPAQTQPPPGGLAFERPDDNTPVDLGGTSDASALRPANLKQPAAPPAPAAAPPAAGDLQLPTEDALKFLFDDAMLPADGPQWPGPRDPNFPLMNPLREEAQFQEELKQWDDWALRTTLQRINRNPDMPDAMLEEMFHREAVEKYAPELFDRYQKDVDFRTEVSLALRRADDLAMADYYQGIADAHKAGILFYRNGLAKLEDDRVLEKGMGLPEQQQRHPEVIPRVQAVYAAAGREEDARLEKAQASAGEITDHYYRLEFGFVRQNAAANSK